MAAPAALSSPAVSIAVKARWRPSGEMAKGDEPMLHAKVTSFGGASANRTGGGRWVEGRGVARKASTPAATHSVPTSAHATSSRGFAPILLLRGVYVVRAWLFDATGLLKHAELYEAARLVVEQEGLEQGYYAQPHRWELAA